MKKKCNNIVIFLIVILSLLFIPNNVGAYSYENTPSAIPSYASYEYVIDKYDINIVVNENNTLDIKESITAYFNVSKHGIYRVIPLRNTVTRLDGTTTKTRTQISNVKVDNEYTTSRANGNYTIKIGSADKTILGEQSYVIEYTYNLGEDPLKEMDELYYDLIGTEWDTVIGNISFTITMPKEFDSTKLGFSSGIMGSTDNSKITYNVVGNQITGSYNGILNPNEALTIRCELEEGYFVGAGLKTNPLDYLMFIFPVIFLGISYYLWYKFGRDSQVVETVEFYPPDGSNSLEVGFLYKGKADNQDVTSLLIYLANKGYIKITETEEKSIFSKGNFKISKLKEYDGNNHEEKLFLDGLFANNATEVTSSDLYNKFYMTMNRILMSINSKENKYKIFERAASSKTIFVILMIIISYCLITIPPIIAFGDPETLIVALIFPGLGFSAMFAILFEKKSSIFTKIFSLFWGGAFGGVPWGFIVLPCLLVETTYLIGHLFGLICIAGMVACLVYLPKRTPYGIEILGKLEGFKNFLETAEKEKLEAMVMEDPSYFYNILPYTYVLGVSDKWIEKFESIALKEPDWYDSPRGFEVRHFGSFMNSTFTSAQSAMTSSPSSSGSGSSGGGFSGGGSGGGGGGSW